MNADFPRILTLLRKERGISQKQAAQQLEISQALLSHYEKGIRECGLDFLLKAANFYHVSCDYLLGRSPVRSGETISVEELPDADAGARENVGRNGIMLSLNKKLIINSLNVIFSMLGKSGSKTLITEASSYLMLAVYRVFRVLYSASPSNDENMFHIPKAVSDQLSNAAMAVCDAQMTSATCKTPLPGTQPVEAPSALALTTERIAQEYPLLSTSLFNLIQNSENKINAVHNTTPRQK